METMPQRSTLRLPKGLANNARLPANRTESGLHGAQCGSGLQVNFFQTYRNQRVVLYLLIGTRLVGEILAYDQYTILLSDPNGHGQLIFKHAISNIQVIGEVA